MGLVNCELSGELLKGVSRSFFLTLRMLPVPMRGPAGLAYLLARASDTVADSAVADPAVRLEVLDRMSECICGGSEWVPVPEVVLAGVDDGRERRVLESGASLIRALRHEQPAVAGLIRGVLATIISGQRADIERFRWATEEYPVVFENQAELDDYTWRVAGCVGAFWTRLALQTLGHGFSCLPLDLLEAKAVDYGKGLQLVNILRDLPADLRNGRCYLPVEDPSDRAMLIVEHQRHVVSATTMIHHGFDYAGSLRPKRLRVASVLPAMIAGETLDLMRGITWERLEARVSIGRSSVYRLLLEAVFH